MMAPQLLLVVAHILLLVPIRSGQVLIANKPAAFPDANGALRNSREIPESIKQTKTNDTVQIIAKEALGHASNNQISKTPLATDIQRAGKEISEVLEKSKIQPAADIPITATSKKPRSRTVKKATKVSASSYEAKENHHIPQKTVSDNSRNIGKEFIDTRNLELLTKTKMVVTEKVTQSADDLLEKRNENLKLEVASGSSLDKVNKNLDEVVQEQALLRKFNEKVGGKVPEGVVPTRDSLQEAKEASELDRKLESVAIALMAFNANGVNISAPLSEMSVELKKENETFTQRIVYVPSTAHLELPCSTAMLIQSPFPNFRWFRERISMRLKRGRVKIGPKRELVFTELLPTDSGRYNCQRITKTASYTNLVDLYVFVPADIAVGFPFKFKAAQCNKEEKESIEGQIKDIFCSSFQSCSFDFQTTCHSTPWYQQADDTDPLSAPLQVLVIKYVNPSFQKPTCDNGCVMRAKLDNVLSEMLTFAYAFKKVGETVRRVGHCTSSSCPSDYVFLPQETYTDSTLLYVCDAGTVVHRISTCVPCLPGEYSPSRGWSDDCQRCPALTYQPDPVAVSCIPCKNRTVSSFVTGATSSDVCSVKKRFTKKEIVGLICLIIIIFIFGILIVIIAVMCCRQCGKKDARDKKSGQIPESATVSKGEKEPLYPVRKTTAGTLLGRTPTPSSANSKSPRLPTIAAAVSAREALRRMARRRATDLPPSLAASKQVASTKSAPSVNRAGTTRSTTAPIPPRPSVPARPASASAVDQLRRFTSAKPASSANVAAPPEASSVLGPSVSQSSFRTPISSNTNTISTARPPQASTSAPVDVSPTLAPSAITNAPMLRPSYAPNARSPTPFAQAASTPSASAVPTQRASTATSTALNPSSSALPSTIPTQSTSAVTSTVPTPSESAVTSSAPTQSASEFTSSQPSQSTSAYTSTEPSKSSATSTLPSNSTSAFTSTGPSESTATSTLPSQSQSAPTSTRPSQSTSAFTSTLPSESAASSTLPSQSTSYFTSTAPSGTAPPSTAATSQLATTAPSAPSTQSTSPGSQRQGRPTVSFTSNPPMVFQLPEPSNAGSATPSTQSTNTPSGSAGSTQATLVPTAAVSAQDPRYQNINQSNPTSRNINQSDPRYQNITQSDQKSQNSSQSAQNNNQSAQITNQSNLRSQSINQSEPMSQNFDQLDPTFQSVSQSDPNSQNVTRSDSRSKNVIQSDSRTKNVIQSDQRPQNISQASRSFSSILSWWSLNSAANAVNPPVPSLRKPPLTTEPQRKSASSEPSNIQLHVLRTKPERTRRAASEVTYPATTTESDLISTGKLLERSYPTREKLLEGTSATRETPSPSSIPPNVDSTVSSPGGLTRKRIAPPIPKPPRKVSSSPVASTGGKIKSSGILWTEKDTELWRSYEATTETDTLVDGADDELHSGHPLSTGPKKWIQKVFKR